MKGVKPSEIRYQILVRYIYTAVMLKQFECMQLNVVRLRVKFGWLEVAQLYLLVEFAQNLIHLSTRVPITYYRSSPPLPLPPSTASRA